MNDLPERLRSLAESLDGDEWEHPLMSREVCIEAATLIELLRNIVDVWEENGTMCRFEVNGCGCCEGCDLARKTRKATEAAK